MTQNSIIAYQQSCADVLAALQSDANRGLSQAEAGVRLERDGRNELVADKPVAGWRKFLAQFQDVLVILLLIATAISFGLWMYDQKSALPYEAIAILSIVLLNAIMGFVQAAKAEQAVAALQAMSAAEATVIRDGERRRVPAAEIVSGDVILIEEGDSISADARLLELTSLKVAEAALTGESLPVLKHTEPMTGDVALGDRRNMIFSGTAAIYGRGKAVVVATGMQSEMGRIAGLLKETGDDITPLQKQLNRTGKILGLIVIAIAVVMMATIIVVENVRGFTAILEVLILGVALAVAAVPEGLPAIVTAVLSLGVQRMARRNAIVRNIAAVETLGSASIIASDKTGTLTRNEMTVRTVVTASGRVELSGSGYAPEGTVSQRGKEGNLDEAVRLELSWVLTVANRANNAALQQQEGRWVVQGDPTEGALLVAVRKAGIDPEQLNARFKRTGEIPFSSERKLMSTINDDSEQADTSLVFTKGAPDVLLSRCSHELQGKESKPFTDARRVEILASTEGLAGEGLRTLGLAYRRGPRTSNDAPVANESTERDLVFAGLIAMMDPPRTEAKDAVARAKGAGIRPVMITGDHPKTAAVIAMELGLVDNDQAITGTGIDALSEADLIRTVQTVSIFARVNPEHKLRIVKALQHEGAVVAMTGDGVNDAPALKAADIGIAMGITGSDVSKQVADMILADDNYASIVAAVEEGRAIYDNIRKFLRFLLSSNLGEVMTMFFGVLLAHPMGLKGVENSPVLPLLATQILWINLVTDGAPALALGLDPPESAVMQQKPRPAKEGVITSAMWFGIFFVSAVMAAGTLLVLDAGLPGGLIEGTGTMAYAQTMAFTTLMLAQLFNVFNARSDSQSAFIGLFTNHWLWSGIGMSILLQLAVIYLPFMQQAFSTVSLSAADWLQCCLVASMVLWLREISKVVIRRSQAQSSSA